MKKKEWFEDWFNTSYYHILYKNRDDVEARKFIHNLLDYLAIKKGSYLLDLACGKGRHSVTLEREGFKVLGADLSCHSIEQAQKCSNENLHFIVHDMRLPIPNEHFDAIFNLFTSFGYFDDQSDNLKVLNSAHGMLVAGGYLVIDFMNAVKVISNLVAEETKVVDDISFHINRKYDGHHIYKRIRFHAEGKDFDYTERVQGLRISDFENLLKEANFKILRTFGDFDLNPFEQNSSDRLIIIAQRG